MSGGNRGKVGISGDNGMGIGEVMRGGNGRIWSGIGGNVRDGEGENMEK